MPDIARRDHRGSAVDAARPDALKAIKALGLNPEDPRAHALLLVCQRYQLDPFLGHVSIYEGKVYVHFAAYLHLANQHPQHKGIETVREWEDDKYCYAEVRVHRYDREFPFQRKGKSLKRKRKKDGTHYDDVEADAKAFAQACRRALRLAYNVEWPEPEPERDPNADEPPPPGPVVEVTRRVQAATTPAAGPPAPPVPPEAGDDPDPDSVLMVVDPETGEMFRPLDQEPPDDEELDAYGWPPERDTQTQAPAGPAVTPPPAGPAAPPAVPEWAQRERAQRGAHGRRGKTSGAGASAPPASAPDPQVPGGVAAGGTGDDPSLLDDGEQP